MHATGLRIGELSRRTGVNPAVLRAWERRYGVLHPYRSKGGQRRYSAADEARVRLMLLYMTRGFPAGVAARLATSPEVGSRRDGGVADATNLAEPVADLRVALDDFDEAAAHTAVDDLLAAAPLDQVLREAILPVLADIGRRWERGELGIAAEHFASALLGGRLRALTRGWDAGAGPLALLACAPGERHELGLVSFGLALHVHGWRVRSLGADTPVEAVEEAAGRVAPALVVVAAVRPEPFAEAAPALTELAGRRALAVGGAGAGRALADRFGARLLARDAVTAAERVALRWRRTAIPS